MSFLPKDEPQRFFGWPFSILWESFKFAALNRTVLGTPCCQQPRKIKFVGGRLLSSLFQCNQLINKKTLSFIMEPIGVPVLLLHVPAVLSIICVRFNGFKYEHFLSRHWRWALIFFIWHLLTFAWCKRKAQLVICTLLATALWRIVYKGLTQPKEQVEINEIFIAWYHFQ